MADKIIKILSVDGGGIRGIIPGLIMNEIEQRTGRPIAELFDYVAGTSTGGILALGLTKAGTNGRPHYTAMDSVRMYRENGAQIFSRSVWHRIRSVGSLIEECYPASGMEGVLDDYFGDARLKDALTNVIITSYEIERRIPWFFRSERAKIRPDYDFSIKQVARATSAAPTYFEPCQIITQTSDNYYALIDGGVFANNPTMCAFVDAKIAHPDADFMVVSLGTGQLTREFTYDIAKHWGMIQWVQPIINILMQGVSETVGFQMQQLLPDTYDGRQRYYRFQAPLIEGNDDMDDASRTNMRVLQLVAEDLIRDNDGALNRLCHDLVTM
jgi:patatin-like phospholipase/acyl hydrolase